MNQNLWKKGIVYTIILLFLGAGTIPAVSGNYANELTSISNGNKIETSKVTIQNNEIDENMDDNGRYVKIFDQPPVSVEEGEWHAYTSDAGAGWSGYKIYENFWAITENIDKVIWWGICGYYDDGWFLGDPEGMNFYIEFYDDAHIPTNAPPTNKINSYNISYENLELIHTGIYINSSSGVKYELIKFEYELPYTITMPGGEGWISIQSHDDSDGDWFLWVNSLSGDSFTYQENSSEPVLDNDTAFQLYYYELDETPPEVSIEKPKESTIYLNNEELFQWPFIIPVIVGNLDIKVNANDSEFVGMDYVEIFINNESKAMLNNEPYTWTWDETGFGSYAIKAIAYDKAGNSATTEEITVFKLF